MRIAVVEFAGRGGLIQYACQLCRALGARGAEVTLITSREHEPLGPPAGFRLDPRLRLWDPKPARGPARSGPWRRATRAVRYYVEWARLIAHLVRTRPDVVQLGDLRFPTDLLCVLALRLGGLTVADVCHNVDPFAGGRGGGMPRRSRVWRLAFTALYRACHVVFAHFDHGRRALVERHGLSPERVAAIPHGDESLFLEQRDPAFGAEHARAELGFDGGGPLALMLGTLTAYKGVDHLLRAFVAVHHALPQARLAVVGYPAPDFDVRAARATAQALGLEDVVRIVPRYIETAQVAGWLEAATVAVFPYRAVSQSGAVLLAQTAGVPVVATRVGAMEDQVEEAVGGLLVPPGDPAALASALVALLADPARAARMGRRAAERVRERFGWDRVAALVLARYEALLAPAAAGARPRAERAQP